MVDLVTTSLEPWDEVWRRNQHLIAGLLRTGVIDRVLFVEPAVDPIHSVLRRERASRGRGLRNITDVVGVESERLWVFEPTKWLPRRIDGGSDRRWGKGIAGTAARLGITRPVLWVNDPIGIELVHITKWPMLYDITDDWLLAERPAAEIARLTRQESALLAAAQQVVVCSPALRVTKGTVREVVLIPNAVDIDAYHTFAGRPADLPPGKIALYLGTIHRDRFDVALCIDTANRLSSSAEREERASVVLVGPAPLPSADLNALRAAGVLVLGPRPSNMVSAYLQHADVLLVPHRLTGFTASLDPIKAYEYRAARRRVVSTPVPGFLEVPDPLVITASPTAFANAVAEAMTDPVPWSPNLPDDIPSWATRVEQMTEVIRRVSSAREFS